MSEAMSNVEIEDVLSSIRRLVSEDLRPAARQVALAADSKLILTPALRVVAEAGVATEPLKPSTNLPRLHLGVVPVTEEVVASLELAVEAQDLEWESETGDPMPDAAAFEWTAGAWHTAPVEAEVIEEVAAEVLPAEPAPWAQEDPGEVLEPQAAVDSAGPEPDPVWADEAEAEVVAGLDTAAAEDSLFAAAGPEMTFDEAVLRDLVRDLIREELQGGLGERITRNVRKLVRAEIARAMATRDLD